MLNSKAAPPSQVTMGAFGDLGWIKWSPPEVPTRNIKGYEVQIRVVKDGAKWQDIGIHKGTSTTFDVSKVGCIDDAPCQARVRTVMAGGLASAFVSSPVTNAWGRHLIPVSLKNPNYGESEFGVTDSGNITTVMWSSDCWNNAVEDFAKDCRYPENAFQLRYSEDGTAWTTASVVAVALSDFANVAPWTPGSTSAPYHSFVEFTGPNIAQAKHVEVRAVGTAGNLAPSRWVEIFHVA